MSLTAFTRLHDHALYLHDQLVGWLHSYDARQGSNNVVLELGGGLSKTGYDWIKQGIEGRSYGDVGIFAFDHSSQPLGGTIFYSAVITDVSFPALDAGSKAPGTLTVKFAASGTKDQESRASSHKTTPPPKEHKQWLPNKFRLQIDGVDACRYATRVEAIVAKGKALLDSIGHTRQVDRIALRTDNTPLLVYFHESDAREFEQWLQDKVIKGDIMTKNGSLDYLAGDRILFSLTFGDLSPFQMDVERQSLHEVAVHFNYETLNFKGNASWS